jgi:hypothetical protein
MCCWIIQRGWQAAEQNTKIIIFTESNFLENFSVCTSEAGKESGSIGAAAQRYAMSGDVAVTGHRMVV